MNANVYVSSSTTAGISNRKFISKQPKNLRHNTLNNEIPSSLQAKQSFRISRCGMEAGATWSSSRSIPRETIP